MDRTSPIKVILPLLLLALASRTMSADERKAEMQRGPTKNPHGPTLKTPCGSCHTSTSWSPIRAIPEFNHNRETNFPLRGMHEKVQCGLCHTKLVFTDVGTKCADCHADIHRGQFGAKCEDCHNVRGWQDGIKSTQEHSARFPLIGAHANVTCDSCHVNAAVGRFVGLSTQCASCHINDYSTAKSVDHKAAGFSVFCESCHNMNTWLGANFDHNATGFPLTGGHATLECAACHIGGRFKATPTDCFSCHVKEFNSTDNPPHAAAAFPKDCSVCHSTVNWLNAKFDHNISQFPLTGAHVTVACNTCHIGGRFAGTPMACYSCHVTEFNATTNPNHRTAGLPTDCSQCHTTANWQNAKFDHGLTKFPLTGAHATVTCNACHIGGQFSNTATACAGCHLPDFNKATNPSHTAAGFSQDCSLCHTTANWLAATFNHNTATKFALTGAHVQLQCAQCHINNVFAGTPMQCAGCHMPDFNKAASPNHVASGFPQTCDTCHTTTVWQPATFDHAKTSFPLTGAHVTTQCLLCHVNNNFKTVSTQCSDCHMTDFHKTTSPNHVAASLPQDCSLCHTTANWTGGKFDHNTATKFPLTGAHVQVQCALCHINNVFAGTPIQCSGCHMTDFNKTTSPNHLASGFPQSCDTCHTTAAWKPAPFDHSKTAFPLTGAHVATTCLLCHVNNNYATLPLVCSGCHMPDFKKTTNPNHVTSGFVTDCQACHTTTAWQPAAFDHSKTTFPLTGAHVATQCALCHVSNNFTTLPLVCSGCHVPDFNKTTNPNHVQSGFPQTCDTCHTTTAWQPASFDHSKTGFVLTGTHKNTACLACHVGNNYNLTSAACYPCHTNEFKGATNPNHVAAALPQDCSLCHSTVDWKGALFDHSKTGFALTGGHIPLQCAQCHISNNFNLTSGACYPCHTTDYNGANNPPHKSGGFPQDCTLCHTTANWTSSTFNHNTTTKFPLTGAHIPLQCAQCHLNGVFTGTPTLCSGCHLPDYNKTTNPNHVTGKFPQTCDSCHTTSAWQPASFDHSKTGFPLTGTHMSTPCTQCHVNNNYTLTATACSTCHMDAFKSATNPNHVASGFPTDCSMCHSTVNWTSSTFDHSKTGFPLTGTHLTTQCAQCHVSNNYNLTSPACATCHLDTYNKTTNPNHKAAGFPTDCSTCHTTVNWNGAVFDHSKTGFALTGGHIPLQCAQCHVSSNYNLTSAACYPCHTTDYNGANNPPHKSAGFPQDCTLCHTTANWTSATFDHSKTGFPLTGTHLTTQCAQCHVSNNYNLTSAACYPCHTKDFNGTTNPNHVSAAFPQDCSLCHTTVNWNGAVFDHSKTGFALTGGHIPLQCAQCHVSNNFNLTSAACYPCHTTDYNGANNPPHKSGGFPQDCTLCHTTANWTSATFDHSKTGFPLTGTHLTTQCAQCHVSNNYNLTSAACYPCHTKDFNGTTNPNHVSAAFPQDCSLCHTTVNWNGAVFDHSKTGFALTGGHIPLQCVQCHISNNYNLTSAACYPCHTTDYNGANNPPHKSAGFPQDCTLCHTTANWTSATFDHAKTGFPLTGTHTTTACAACHISNNYALTSAACANCHLTNYNATTNPNHKAAGFPTDCSLCHTTVNWSGAVFDHSKTGFALTGGHIPLQCAQCHISNNFNLTSPACYPCHVADFTGTTNPPHVSAGFPQDCTLCHTTTNWTSSTFNHANTGFPLTGTHTTTACAACHISNNYALTSTACYPCHTADYNGTTNPSHVASGFPQDCSQCHSTTNWAGAVFNHAATGFTLTGTHLTTPCLSCHVSNNYKLTSAACYPCHVANFTGTTNPPHVTSGFPQDCSLCHTTVDWTGAVFNHATTGFALTGTHATTACALCHVSNNYNLTSAACANCHLATYQATTTPNHTAAGFPTTCDTCHNFVNWAGATFTHPTTPFALTGAHLTVPCLSCHINNVFAATPTDCYSCHKADYTGTNNPAHITAGFPTTCATCHTTTVWTGATFNHTWFPITSGNHNQPCAVCHINSADYTVFSCDATCHAKATTDSHHNGVKNYVWNATSCFSCHPSGRAG